VETRRRNCGGHGAIRRLQTSPPDEAAVQAISVLRPRTRFLNWG
jgi:hypothetical protein